MTEFKFTDDIALDLLKEITSHGCADREFDWTCIFCLNGVPWKDQHTSGGSHSIEEPKYHDEDCIYIRCVNFLNELKEESDD
jgi:hypothetical protein